MRSLIGSVRCVRVRQYQISTNGVNHLFKCSMQKNDGAFTEGERSANGTPRPDSRIAIAAGDPRGVPIARARRFSSEIASAKEIAIGPPRTRRGRARIMSPDVGRLA